MFAIRPEHAADAAAVHAVLEAAFPTDAEARLVARLRLHSPYLALVAEADGHVAGHVAFTQVSVVEPDHTRHALVSAPLGLIPAPLHHLPPVHRIGPLPALPAGVDRDHGGPHPEILPRVTVVLLGVERGIRQDPAPGYDQGRLGHDRAGVDAAR